MLRNNLYNLYNPKARHSFAVKIPAFKTLIESNCEKYVKKELINPKLKCQITNQIPILKCQNYLDFGFFDFI
ncbi:MAG: hypothetical protein C4584_02475 [Armatimonadetes bacterium]|nr:MAG: hypothetical protein C4584_02475 [Armatimonadota bacterium]